MKQADAVIVGAGTAGMMVAISYARRGGRICVLEKGSTSDIGGCLLINRGQMSGAGTRLQEDKLIEDTPNLHYEDAMRISHGTSLPEFLRMALDRQGPFIDWLMDNGFEMEDDMPRIIHGHEAYKRPRTYWGKNEGRSILKLLKPMFEEQVEKGLIDIKIKSEVKDLIVDESGAVIGVLTVDGQKYLGRSIVLATGGYAANAELFGKLHGGLRLWSGAYRYAQGQGLEAALKVGGVFHLADYYVPGWAGFWDHTLEHPRFAGLDPGLTPQSRSIWEIFVNDRGKRFVAEDNESVHIREAELFKQPDQRAWIIYDQEIRDQAPELFVKWAHLDMDQFYRDSADIHQCQTLGELAEECGVDIDGLRETIERYNQSCESGKDPFGRKHFPCKIESPPFYAAMMTGYSVRAKGGLKANTQLRVIDKTDKPIPNLYAVGEILGSVFSGKASVGGMSLTPALALGKMLGEEILPL